MTEKIIFERSSYKIVIGFEENVLDYYSDISITLSCNGKNTELFKDNFLCLKNIVEKCGEGIKIIDFTVDEKNAGILLNNYYKGLIDGRMDETIILNDDGEWIGEEFCCLMSKGYATWLYRHREENVIKVTPIFDGFEENDIEEKYNRFIENYADVFRDIFSDLELKQIRNGIISLYNDFYKE